jgi:hypothetical protein
MAESGEIDKLGAQLAELGIDMSVNPPVRAGSKTPQ